MTSAEEITDRLARIETVLENLVTAVNTIGIQQQTVTDTVTNVTEQFGPIIESMSNGGGGMGGMLGMVARMAGIGRGNHD